MMKIYQKFVVLYYSLQLATVFNNFFRRVYMISNDFHPSTELGQLFYR